MKLGKLQRMWINSLRENPERQTDGVLGEMTENFDEYKACCLGELHICYHRMNSLDMPIINNKLLDIDDKLRGTDDNATLIYSWDKYGLYDKVGTINKSRLEHNSPALIDDNLAVMNDNGISWLEIADFIEKNPKAVFKKSV